MAERPENRILDVIYSFCTALAVNKKRKLLPTVRFYVPGKLYSNVVNIKKRY